MVTITATAFLLWGECMKWLAIILTAMFVAAKLIHTIAWPWWLVLLPLWIYIALVALVLLIVFVVEVLKDV